MGEITIVNIIASTRVEGSIDIETLALKMSGVQYEPEIFSGLIYRKTKPKITIIMFYSGKISSHGAKSEDEAKEAILTTLKEIDDIGCIIGRARMEDIEIVNVVGTGSLGYTPDIEYIHNHLCNVIYEPERFPGLLYRPYADSVVCLIFSSGKVVVVGAKSESQIAKAFQDTKKACMRCRHPSQVQETHSPTSSL